MIRKSAGTTAGQPAGAGFSELARQLRLTPMQRRYCEALAADPVRNRTQGAIAAGASATKGSASVVASKWLRLAKVSHEELRRVLLALDVARRELALAARPSSPANRKSD